MEMLEGSDFGKQCSSSLGTNRDVNTPVANDRVFNRIISFQKFKISIVVLFVHGQLHSDSYR